MLTSFKKPDLNAPRFRKEATGTLNAAFFRRFRKNYPDLALTDKEIKQIVLTFQEIQMEAIINNRDGVELLSQLGYVFIGSCKKKKSDNPDVEISHELGVKIQHKNFESNQWLAKIFYTNWETTYSFRNHDLWYLEPGREFKRAVSRAYRKDFKKYIIIDNVRYISKLFRSMSYKLRKTKEEQHITATAYDEFAL